MSKETRHVKGIIESILFYIPGYYQVPRHSTIKLSPALTHLQLTSSSSNKYQERIIPKPWFPYANPGPSGPPNAQPSIPLIGPSPTEKNTTKLNPDYDSEILFQGFEALKTFNLTYILSKEMLTFTKEAIIATNVNIAQIENKELKIIVILLCIGVGVLYRILLKNSTGGSIYGSYRYSYSFYNSYHYSPKYYIQF